MLQETKSLYSIEQAPKHLLSASFETKSNKGREKYLLREVTVEDLDHYINLFELELEKFF